MLIVLFNSTMIIRKAKTYGSIFTAIIMLLSLSVVQANTNESVTFDGENWLLGGGKLSDNNQRKSKDGLGIWVSATKATVYSTAGDKLFLPKNQVTETVMYNEQLYIMLFVSNPTVNENGKADISCGVAITDPNNYTTYNLVSDCFRDEHVTISPPTIYRTVVSIALPGTKGSVGGQHEIRVNVTDKVGHKEGSVKLNWIYDDNSI